MEISDGPILFDKSFLQRLDPVEAKAFDMYQTFVCDQLYMEILGDYSKDGGEKTFSLLAKKIPLLSRTTPGSFYLAAFNLLGYAIPMTGDLPVIEDNIIFSINHENIHQYLKTVWPETGLHESEINVSGQRRAAVSEFPERFDSFIEIIHAKGYTAKTCTSLEKAYEQAISYLLNCDASTISSMIYVLLHLEDLPFSDLQTKDLIINACRNENYQKIIDRAPYAAYVLGLEVFFQIALASKHFKKEGNSLTDMRYLHYLPFCKYFVSGDKLHKRLFPILKSDDQIILCDTELKEWLQLQGSRPLDSSK
jgi:hypothetical protein